MTQQFIEKLCIVPLNEICFVSLIEKSLDTLRNEDR